MTTEFNEYWTEEDEAEYQKQTKMNEMETEYEKPEAEDEYGWDGPDPDGEIAMERYYDAQATRRSWHEPEWAR